MRRKGFTLVELLIVIGIVSVLISILLPAMARARESARSAVCASNLRQLHLASINYAADNGNFLPPAHLFYFTKNLDRWHGTRQNQTLPFDFSKSRLKPYLQVSQIKLCPDFEPTSPDGFEQSAGGYGYNDMYLGSSIGVPSVPKGENVPAKMSMVHKPAETIMFADAAMAYPGLIEYSFVEPPFQGDGSQSSPSIHFRHNGRANVIWLDGHVTSQLMEWTYPINFKEVDNAQVKLGYFGPHDNSLFDRR